MAHEISDSARRVIIAWLEDNHSKLTIPIEPYEDLVKRVAIFGRRIKRGRRPWHEHDEGDEDNDD